MPEDPRPRSGRLRKLVVLCTTTRHLARKEARTALVRALALANGGARRPSYPVLLRSRSASRGGPRLRSGRGRLHRTGSDSRQPAGAHDLDTANPTDLAEEAATTYERIIHLCIQASQYDRAVHIFGDAQAKHPELARRLNYNLAKIYLAQGQPDKALDHLDDYLKTQPQGAEAYQLEAPSSRRLGRREARSCRCSRGTRSGTPLT